MNQTRPSRHPACNQECQTSNQLSFRINPSPFPHAALDASPPRRPRGASKKTRDTTLSKNIQRQKLNCRCHSFEEDFWRHRPTGQTGSFHSKFRRKPRPSEKPSTGIPGPATLRRAVRYMKLRPRGKPALVQERQSTWHYCCATMNHQQQEDVAAEDEALTGINHSSNPSELSKTNRKTQCNGSGGASELALIRAPPSVPSTSNHGRRREENFRHLFDQTMVESSKGRN